MHNYWSYEFIYLQTAKTKLFPNLNCITFQLFVHKFLLLFSFSATCELNSTWFICCSQEFKCCIWFNFHVFLIWSTSTSWKKVKSFSLTLCNISNCIPCKSFHIFSIWFFIYFSYLKFHTIDFWHELCNFSFPLVQSSFVHCSVPLFFVTEKTMRVHCTMQEALSLLCTQSFLFTYRDQV